MPEYVPIPALARSRTASPHCSPDGAKFQVRGSIHRIEQKLRITVVTARTPISALAGGIFAALYGSTPMGELDTLKSIVLVAVTAFIAYHGITYRDENGDSDIGHLLFGCIALIFCMRFFFVDLLKVFGE